MGIRHWHPAIHGLAFSLGGRCASPSHNYAGSDANAHSWKAMVRNPDDAYRRKIAPQVQNTLSNRELLL
jgi:hypothetical protein